MDPQLSDEIESVIPYPKFNTLLVTVSNSSQKRVILYNLTTEGTKEVYDEVSFCEQGLWRMLNRNILFFEGDEVNYIYNLESGEKILLNKEATLLFPFGYNEIVGLTDTNLIRWKIGSQIKCKNLDYTPSKTGRFWDLKVFSKEIWVPSREGLLVFDDQGGKLFEWPLNHVLDVLFLEKSNHIQIRHNPKIAESIEFFFDSFFFNLKIRPLNENIFYLISKLSSLGVEVNNLKNLILDSNLDQPLVDATKDNILTLSLKENVIFRYKVLKSGYVSMDRPIKASFSNLSDLKREALDKYKEKCRSKFRNELSLDKVPITQYTYFLFTYGAFCKVQLEEGEDTGRVSDLTQIVNDQYRIYSPDLSTSLLLKTKKIRWITNDSYVYLDSGSLKYVTKKEKHLIPIPYRIKDFVYEDGMLALFSQEHFKVINLEKFFSP